MFNIAVLITYVILSINMISRYHDVTFSPSIVKNRQIYSFLNHIYLRRVSRYQRGNQKPYIEEQTTQWLKEKVPVKR